MVAKYEVVSSRLIIIIITLNTIIIITLNTSFFIKIDYFYDIYINL